MVITNGYDVNYAVGILRTTTPPKGLHPDFYKHLEELKKAGITPKFFIVGPTKKAVKNLCQASLLNQGGFYWWFNNITATHYIGSAIAFLSRLNDQFLFRNS